MKPNEAAFRRALDEALKRADEETWLWELTPRGLRLVETEQQLQEMFNR